MERDWAADEAKAWLIHRDHDQLHNLVMALFAERRRLAELLTWRPGPPTEPGLYLVRAKFGGDVVYSHDVVDADYRRTDVVQHLGPLPQPPSEEAANG